LENLSHKIMSDEKWMEGLTKAERFEMIQLLGHCLKATIRASDTPKDWPEGEGVNPGYFYLWGQSIYVSELISELVKAKGKRQLGAGQQHMDIPLDTPTFELLIESYREYDEQFRYQLKQKGRVIDAGPIPF